MDFSDSPQEAAFRAEVRDFIDGSAPHYLAEHLAKSGFGNTNTGEYDTWKGYPGDPTGHVAAIQRGDGFDSQGKLVQS